MASFSLLFLVEKGELFGDIHILAAPSHHHPIEKQAF
jgi:hypothetical protein